MDFPSLSYNMSTDAKGVQYKWMVNTVDPDEMAPSHLEEVRCLQRCLYWSAGMKQF